MARQFKKEGEMVLVDPRILAAAAAEQKPTEDEQKDLLLGVAPLITGKGTAELGDITVDYDEASQVVRFRNGGTMTKLELYQFVFGICDPKTREELMPVRHTEMTTLTKVHLVELKRDMRKGERMKVRCQTNVETAVVDSLKGLRS